MKSLKPNTVYLIWAIFYLEINEKKTDGQGSFAML